MPFRDFEIPIFEGRELAETDDFPVFQSWPANVHGDTQPFQSLGLRILQKQADALYLAATGDDLDDDAAFSAGHKHNEWSSLLRWRQLGSWRPQGGKDDDVREGVYVSNTGSRNFLWGSILVPLDAAGTDLPESRIIPRYRVSNPAPGSSTPGTLTILSTLYYPSGGALTSLATVPPLYVTSTSTVTFSDVWFEGPPVILDGPTVASVGGFLYWRLEAAVSAGDAVLYEAQLGWLEG
jgi:hypothetical protein